MSNWHDVLTGEAFRAWLIALTQRSKVSPGTRLDPFATSLRRSGFIPGYLNSIEQGSVDKIKDPTQALTDLAQIGVARKTEVSGGVLTPLGLAVQAEWKSLEIDDETNQHEIARCIVLVREGIATRTKLYLEMARFWSEIRGLYDVDSLLERPHGLYLLSYLNQDIGGFNPWTVVRSAHWEVPESSALDWEDLLRRLPGSGMEAATDTLRRRINDSGARSAGRVAFCRALELAAQDLPSAKETLKRWETSGQITSEELEAAVKALELGTSDACGDQQVFSELESLVNDRHNVILYGPPGTGKTRAAFALADEWQRRHGAGSVLRVTFHPSYSYEDFVQGFRPDPKDPSRYTLQQGILLRACEVAEASATYALSAGSSAPHVLLVIDEINRGDTARIFGELITFIEGDKRGVYFTTAQEPDLERSIPRNLYILGTMNTADRSVSLMDVALRRRFAFVGYPPAPDVLGPKAGWHSVVEGIELPALLRSLNSALEAEGIEPERAIGHALLGVSITAAAPFVELRRRFEFDVIPLVSEYCSLDRKGVRRVLGDLVDDRGVMTELSDDDLLTALKQLAAKS